MLVRFFIAIAVGLLVGLVLYEGVLTAHGLFSSGDTPLESMIDGATLSITQALILSFYWILGASASALMAAGLARSRWAGAMAAFCWTLPLALLIGLSQQSLIFLTLALSISVLAALLGLRLSTPGFQKPSP